MVNVKVETIDGVVICQPVGELDAASVAAFRSTCSFTCWRPAGEVALSCNRPTLIRLLETTGFDRIVSVTRDRASAVATLAAARS